MTEYWLISAPGDKTCQQTWETMNNVTSKQNNLCVNYKFHIPDLKVGTLDQLVGLSDDLGKLDNFVDQVTRKVAAYLGEVLEDQRDKLHENLLANNKVHGQPEDNIQTELTGQSKSLANGQATCSPLQRSLSNSIGSEHDFNTTCACRSQSPSDECSDTFDWWFQRHKGSNKSRSRSSSQINMAGGVNSTHRSSPVSSCCGSSQGRSSPDVELNGDGVGEPPPMPLSPADLPTYITRFQWDMAKYPIKQSLRNIADIISKQVTQIELDLKTKSNAYNNLKGTLQNLEKKQTGSLQSRSLVDLVKKEHFILDSEYLTTLLVVVPKNSANDWIHGYEKLTDMVVPRSSSLIFQDNEHALFNVTLFKKVVDEFKLHAREKRFLVRDFVYNEEELAAGKNEITKLVTDKKKQFGPLVRWLKVNFSECFCAWIHVKALRVFVESVLRYGLPVNFQAILIHPNKKSMKRLRDVLNQIYGHLDGSASSSGGQADQNMEMINLGFGQTEYYPYVYYKINIDMVDSKA